MRNFILVLMLTLFSTVSFSQLKGFGFISESSTRIVSKSINLTDGKDKGTTQMYNMFVFSLNDNVLFHTISDGYDFNSQFYQITDVKHNLMGERHFYLITCLSGLSGSEYTYYIEIEGEYAKFNQIHDADVRKKKTLFTGSQYDVKHLFAVKPFHQ